MSVQFATSFVPIARDVDASRSFYRDTLGLSFEGKRATMFLPTSSKDDALRTAATFRGSACLFRHAPMADRHPGLASWHRVRGP